MCHMWFSKAKIQPQMAVSGNADIFSIKVDSRLKTILFPTGVGPEMNFNSVLFEKFVSSPKCRFRECSWRGIHKMPDQPKPSLKVGQSGWNFHRKLSLYQRMNLYWAGPLEGHFNNFNFRGVEAHDPSSWKCQVYHNIANTKPKFNFLHILIINEDILGTIGALHVWPEITSPKYCCKNRQK